MKKVLVLGMDNGSRSQIIAELIKHISFNRIEVYSAGIKPKKVDPKTVKILKEIGINIEGAKTHSMNEYIHTHFDIIITTTKEARDKANAILNASTKIHKELPDPRLAEGDDFDKENAYRELREEINEWLNEFITRHRLIAK